MKKFTTLFSLLLLLTLFAVTSCEYETLAPVKLDIPDGETLFATDVLPFLVDKCSGCHAGGIAPNLKSDQAYNSLTTGKFVDTKNPSASKIVKKIDDGHPTPTTLTLTQKALLLKWIKEGAKNN